MSHSANEKRDDDEDDNSDDGDIHQSGGESRDVPRMISRGDSDNFVCARARAHVEIRRPSCVRRSYCDEKERFQKKNAKRHANDPG